ncbi:MAG: prepilin-type N-terminal cleavage/methylation domain-containing protein [Peptococcaceae bacterium]|nr:prepilin-type N-terminal cleavage/methylation domain-containing protein [Candidatus Syntrophopropionicum ammoniitolerans]
MAFFFNQKGMSLIEVTVGLLIFGVTIIPLLCMYRDGSVYAAVAGEKVAVLNLARGLIEEIKGMPDARLGLVQGATGNTVTLEQRAGGAKNFYQNYNLAICRGTGSGQIKKITGYDGVTHQAVLDGDWQVLPDTSSFYLLYRYYPTDYHYTINVVEGDTTDLTKTLQVTVYYTEKNQERQVSLTTERLVR